MKSIGFIGFGNMGSAIARGIRSSQELSSRFSALAYDASEAARSRNRDLAEWCDSPQDLAARADYVLLAVKPYLVAGVIDDIRSSLGKDKTLMSIAAGVPLSRLRSLLGGLCPAIQIMPNTPAAVGQGAFALCLDDPDLGPERAEEVRLLFASLGHAFVMPESKMNAFSAVAGCGPAYVFHFMDAVMEAAVTLGFTRQEATEMVTALFKGSAALVEESGQHPAVLHASVTSPGGMTIVGTNHLARTAVRGHIIDAVLAADARGKEMEKE